MASEEEEVEEWIPLLAAVTVGDRRQHRSLALVEVLHWSTRVSGELGISAIVVDGRRAALRRVGRSWCGEAGFAWECVRCVCVCVCLSMEVIVEVQ
jgi:hypothetical protein